MTGCDLLVLGHTHVPFEKHFEAGSIVNPGSVGQPRDGEPGASWTLYETTTGKAENRRVDYDIEVVARRVREVGLPRSLAERLYIGR
jgi:predicted phosphodiesterase